jgi:hypothetical protein
MIFELIERITRFKALLYHYPGEFHNTSQATLLSHLNDEVLLLEKQFFSQHALLLQIQEDSSKLKPEQLFHHLVPVMEALYFRLCKLTQLLVHQQLFRVHPETQMFMAAALPYGLYPCQGEPSVFLLPEGDNLSRLASEFPDVMMDALSILQRNNPLGWMGLAESFTNKLLANNPVVEELIQDIYKLEKEKLSRVSIAVALKAFLPHALQLRLLGPSYYFHSLSEGCFTQNTALLHTVEPVLFFGLNHQNFTHKSFVLLHEACERSKLILKPHSSVPGLSDDALTRLFAASEKLIPEKHAFQDKHFQRALKLQGRMNEGLLISSTPVYPLQEVAENLRNTIGQSNFSIYTPLAMMTEYPHNPREILNAGWLYKMEQLSFWFYTVLNDNHLDGLRDTLDEQDHRLRKSIEVSEVHNMLLCNT